MAYAGEVTYRIEGYRLRIRWENEEIGEALRGLRNPNYHPEENEASTTYSLRSNDNSIAIYKGSELDGSATLESLALVMERKIQLEVATHAPEAVFVHSGVVRVGDQAIIFPGRTYTGKSTLTNALCKAGAKYYSDEYAVVDSTGNVRPWPRPITLRKETGPQQIPAAQLNWRPEFGPIPVGLVLVSRYCEGSQWEPQTLSPGQAMLSLLENTVTARTQPQRAMEYLTRLLNNAHSLRSDRGDADETAQNVLQSCEQLFRHR